MPSRPTQPNMPEITKTTLPLLSTVLAGFAVSIMAQLFIESKTNQAWPPGNLGLFLGLLFLAVSVPWFLTSTIFAVWGQSYNYQYLTPEVRPLLMIELKDEALNNYLRILHRKWQMWHTAAVRTFALGLVAFVGGTGILLWTFIGFLIAFMFIIMIVLSLIGSILNCVENQSLVS